jgi:hypothetical protein
VRGGHASPSAHSPSSSAAVENKIKELTLPRILQLWSHTSPFSPTTNWNKLEQIGTNWNKLEHIETSWNNKQQQQQQQQQPITNNKPPFSPTTNRNELEQNGTKWNKMEQIGTTNNKPPFPQTHKPR